MPALDSWGHMSSATVPQPDCWAHLEETEESWSGPVLAVVGVVRGLGVGAGVGQHHQWIGEPRHERDLDSRPAHAVVHIPMAMIIGGMVSCCRFSANDAPFAVVVGNSGTEPSTSGSGADWQPGFIGAPIPSRMTDGAKNISARAAIAVLRNTAAPQRRGCPSWDSRNGWQVGYVGAQTTNTVNRADARR